MSERNCDSQVWQHFEADATQALDGPDACVIAQRLSLLISPAESGGLVFYGPSLPDMHRSAAVFVDKILRGAKPADFSVSSSQLGSSSWCT
jgi:hypothetical protein